MNDDKRRNDQLFLPGLGVRALVVFLAFVALGIALYLMYVSVIAKGQPVGCGPESGCAEVLTSRWSVYAGIPVSVPAAMTYVALIATIFALPLTQQQTRKTVWQVAVTLGILLLFSAGWFIGLQVYYLKAICPWCITEHILGTIIAVTLLISHVAMNKTAVSDFSRGNRIVIPFFVALLLIGQMIAVQTYSRFEGPAVQRLANNENDVVSGEGAAKTVSMLNGKIVLTPSECPMIGSADAEHLVFVMFDYCCPHCRTTHGYLLNAMEEFPDQLALVMLPVPLNADCNKHWKTTEPRFKESCKLATLALTVWRADPEKFVEFDKWLFESEKPRAYNDALEHAKSLIGANQLSIVEAKDNYMKNAIERNVEFFNSSNDDASDVKRLPILLSPRVAGVVGRPGSQDELFEILKSEFGLRQRDQ